MQPSGLGGPPPGWYPDPAGHKAWRWWDGTQWTEYASDPSSLDPYGYGSQPAGEGYQHPLTAGGNLLALQCFGAEQKSVPWSRRAFAIYVAVVLLTLIGAWAQRSHLRDIFHMLRVEIDTDTRQPATRSADFSGLTSLALLIEVPFYIITLVWQYRAARVARYLGLPASRSPGLGVWGWFIPVVNFWFPYQALRDCLPPGDPGRRTVARLWASFLVLLVLNPTCTVLAVFASPAVFLVAAGLSVVAGICFSASGIRLVGQIEVAHRQLLGPPAALPRPG